MESMVMQDILSFYKGKRVLVTGDTGFKGSWLSLWLKELGAEVTGYALPPERDNDHFYLLGLDKLIHHIDGDIRDLPKLKRIMDEFQPDFLFHLAAQALVRLSYDDPKLTFDTNISGSVNILEAVRLSSSLRSVIYVTSDKCYRNKEWIWGYRENDELGGRDPYSASKAAAEVVFSSYVDSFFSKQTALGIASVRAGNVIGGGDWAADRIVPDSIKFLQLKEPIVLRNPSATRPWQHVLEPLYGYLMLAVKLYNTPENFSGSWNFGPGGESIRTVQELSEKIICQWGEGEVRCNKQSNAPHEATLLHLNCDKAHHLLGWNSRWDFDRTVTETVKWYKEVVEGKPALGVTKKQICDFMEGTK
jgi:CDP-glucose 4,6-dehydratase